MRVGATKKLAQLVTCLDAAFVINLDRIHARETIFDAVPPPRIAINNAGDVASSTVAATADGPLSGGGGARSARKRQQSRKRNVAWPLSPERTRIGGRQYLPRL
jgi:hypothetical protein